MKKITPIFLAILILVAFGATSVLAISLKEEKVVQPKDIEEQSTSENVQSNDEVDLNEEKSAPDFIDEKTRIIEKMLNTVDYFDTAMVEVIVLEPNIPEPKIITMHTSQNESLAYQKILAFENEQTMKTRESPVSDFETVCDGNRTIQYNNIQRNYVTVAGITERMDHGIEYSKDDERFYIDDEGIVNCQFRVNSTNVDMASYSLLPQELTFGLLCMNRDLWEVIDTQDYLGRNSLVIEGKTADEYGNKIGVASFKMYVDEETGILLKLEGFDSDGEIRFYTEVTNIKIDNSDITRNLTVKVRDAKYSDYEEIENYYNIH